MALALVRDSAKYWFNYYLWKPLSWLWRSWIPARLGWTMTPTKRGSKTSTKNSLTTATLANLDAPDTFSMVAVGRIESVYKEKFGTPRQGNLVPHGRGCLVLDKRAVDTQWSLDALQEFSHVWLVFVFHANTNVKGKATPNSKVRPPQGAGTKIGVFATRSPHRPNPIGLTMAHIVSVDTAKGVVYLDGLDLCDGTPVLDIKPYCEHVDWPGPEVAVTPKWVTNPKFERASVTFSDEALKSLRHWVDEVGECVWYKKGESDVVKQAIEEIISLDPRDLNRGRGAFSSVDEGKDKAVPIKETAFTRREERIRAKAATRLVYVRFDELDITFRPDDESRSFHVIAIDRYKDRQVNKSKDESLK